MPISSIHPRFFYHQLRSINLKTLGYARHYRLLRQVEISVPEMEIQQQIVSMLDELDEQVSAMSQLQKHNLESLNELRQSVLEIAFNGKPGGVFK